MIYNGLEIKGHKNKKLEQVIQYLKNNNINTLKDINNIKSDNIKVFKFWNETGVDIASLEVKEYTPEFKIKRYNSNIIIDNTAEFENSLEFKIVKFFMSIVLLLGILGYLFTFLGYQMVRIV